MRQIGELRFSQDHLGSDWMRMAGGLTIGISDYFQERLGDISNLRLPKKGKS